MCVKFRCCRLAPKLERVGRMQSKSVYTTYGSDLKDLQDLFSFILPLCAADLGHSQVMAELGPQSLHENKDIKH